MAALTKRKLITWLLENEFKQLSIKGTSHQKYKHESSGIAISIPGHGRKELSNKHTGMIMRELERAGFDRAVVRHELGIS